MLEYFVPIESSAELDGDFTINGIAINETTTTNGHKFIGEELSKAARTLIGVPLLKDHNNSVDSIVGKVNLAHWDEVQRNIPFNAVVKDAKVKQLIKDGLLNTVSVGAHVRPEDIEETEDGDIIPHNIEFKELSVVAVPADGGATFNVALNNAYKLHSINENSTKTERGDNMTEEEKTTETEETPVEEETKEEPKVEAEPEVKAEESAFERGFNTAMKIKVKAADADEEPKEEVKEEPKEEEEETEETEEEEEAEEESDEVEGKEGYVFTQGHNSIGIQRKSYVY